MTKSISLVPSSTKRTLLYSEQGSREITKYLAAVFSRAPFLCFADLTMMWLGRVFAYFRFKLSYWAG